MKKLYLVPLNYNQGYVESYLSAFNGRVLLLESPWACLKVPLFSRVFIEDPHKFMWTFFLRIDLYLIHVPRGGGGFKIGWRTDKRTKWYIWLKLWRRNCIIVSSHFFIPYFKKEERLFFYQKIHVAMEPLVDAYGATKSLESREGIKNVLIALGDCAVEEDYLKLQKHLSGFNILNSVHPRLRLNISNDSFNWQDIDLVILDKSVSMSLFLTKVKIPFIVLSDYNTGREMAYKTEDLYSNMVLSDEIRLHMEYRSYSELKFELGKSSLVGVINNIKVI